EAPQQSGGDFELPRPHLSRDVRRTEALLVLDQLLFDLLALVDDHVSAREDGGASGQRDFLAAIVDPVICAVGPAQAEFIFPKLAAGTAPAHRGLYARAIFGMNLLDPVFKRLLGAILR